jgi:hypothetical protein
MFKAVHLNCWHSGAITRFRPHHLGKFSAYNPRAFIQTETADVEFFSEILSRINQLNTNTENADLAGSLWVVPSAPPSDNPALQGN